MVTIDSYPPCARKLTEKVWGQRKQKTHPKVEDKKYYWIISSLVCREDSSAISSKHDKIL